MSAAYARRYPRGADLIRYQAGAAVAAAVDCRKRAAAVLGRSVDVLDRYCGAHESNPIYRASLLALSVDRPEHLATHMRIVVERKALDGRTLESLRAELAEIVESAEPAAGHAQTTAALAYQRTGDPAPLRAALEAEAALRIRACAIIDRIAEIEAEQPS